VLFCGLNVFLYEKRILLSLEARNDIFSLRYSTKKEESFLKFKEEL